MTTAAPPIGGEHRSGLVFGAAQGLHVPPIAIAALISQTQKSLERKQGREWGQTPVFTIFPCAGVAQW